MPDQLFLYFKLSGILNCSDKGFDYAQPDEMVLVTH